jgi:hypothetical protein
MASTAQAAFPDMLDIYLSLVEMCARADIAVSLEPVEHMGSAAGSNPAAGPGPPDRSRG